MDNLTVIMATYNENKKELNCSINSILNQTYSNFVFFIIDDNPLSNKLKRYLLDKSLEDRRIHILFNKHNVGLVKSLNKGIMHTHSRFIARMDADDISNKNRFSLQFEFMSKYKLDFVLSNNNYLKNGKLSSNKCMFRHSIVDQAILKNIFCHYHNISVHSSWLVKTEIFRRLQGYRNVKAAEDFDFVVRALIYGYRLGYQRDILLLSRNRGSSISNNNSLSQFFNAFIIRKYLKKNHYKDVFPIKVMKNLYNKDVNKNSIESYNYFSKCWYNLKNNCSINNLFRFMFSIMLSKNSMRYLFQELLFKFNRIIISNLIINNLKNK